MTALGGWLKDRWQAQRQDSKDDELTRLQLQERLRLIGKDDRDDFRQTERELRLRLEAQEERFMKLVEKNAELMEANAILSAHNEALRADVSDLKSRTKMMEAELASAKNRIMTMRSLLIRNSIVPKGDFEDGP